MKTRLTRRREFRCRTFALAGRAACLTPDGFGQDFAVEVTLEAEVDPRTGMIRDVGEVDRALGEALDPFERAAPAAPPTAARVAEPLWANLRARFGPALARLRVYESDRLWVDVWP